MARVVEIVSTGFAVPMPLRATALSVLEVNSSDGDIQPVISPTVRSWDLRVPQMGLSWNQRVAPAKRLASSSLNSLISSTSISSMTAAVAVIVGRSKNRRIGTSTWKVSRIRERT